MTWDEAAWIGIAALQTVNFALFFLFKAYIFIAPILLPLSIWKLRRTHAHHIYVIWLFFSFFFVLFVFLFVAAAHNNVQLEGVFGEEAKKVFIVALNWLRDGEGEIKLVLVMLGLVVLPQWLTYVLSGLSGSASPPVFVSQVTELAIWSLVKFSAALAGIVLAEPIVKIVRGGSFESFLILEAAALLGGAFFLVWMNSVARYGMERLYRRRAFRPLRPLHKFFIRFREANSGDKDRATRADQSIR